MGNSNCSAYCDVSQDGLSQQPGSTPLPQSLDYLVTDRPEGKNPFDIDGG